MTALKKYQRLETFGIWHASPQDQRRDVIVSLGEATLTISDSKMTALSHWSLPAIERLNPGEEPACFGPGPDMTEVLELDDEMMISAIEKVRTALIRRRAQPRRLRHLIRGAIVLALLAGAVFWLPGALVRQAVAVVPAAKRIELGKALLTDIRRISGSPCETVLGRRALDRLRTRLLPDTSGRLVVLPAGVALSEHLPGGFILLNRGLVEDYEDVSVVAGHVLVQDQAARDEDPLRRLLEQAGVFATLRLLATGTLSEATLAAHAETLVKSGLVLPPTAELVARFKAAGVPTTPFAYAMDITGETTLPLIEADPVPPGEGRPVLADSDWVSLQGICGE
ncbi:hypothetical protein [Frigidibacter sp. ROC022]|uniref:hypothetical protein n=1 Tax=Frigidibacter sp. ROC022 TaxID=2971796 RepID=UPI00215A8A9F|nr:hypothetical protein [Frigidibacter sp. ROC022]MCR8722970.1 hypothetical protein [Frigidibacter sp. ROC022]